jgi:hypothetical protein
VKAFRLMVLVLAGSVIFPDAMVNAKSISGTLELAGPFALIDSAGTTATLESATSNGAFDKDKAVAVNSSDDLGALLSIGSTVNLTDFQIKPPGPSLVVFSDAGNATTIPTLPAISLFGLGLIGLAGLIGLIGFAKRETV